MQLHALALYSHDGQRRVLRFKPGALNVISGVSGTGKTAVLDIIDYCFGRSGANLPTGPIKDKVSWYALLLGDRERAHLMVARPVPSGQTSIRAMLRAEANVELPDPDDLAVNSDRTALRAALDRMLGLGGFDIPQYGTTRDRLQASVSHAIQFCLQKQLELMSDRYLFHRQDDEEVADDFAALFPYFIGAVDEETLEAQRRANEMRRRLRSAERRLATAEAGLDDLQRRDEALAGQAREAGLVPPDTEEDGLRELLRTAAEGQVVEGARDEDFAAKQRQLRRELQEARAQLRQLSEQRAALAELDDDRSAHAHALDVQAGRLGMAASLDTAAETHDPETCVLCGGEMDAPDDTARDLAQVAGALDAQITEMRSAAKEVGAAERVLNERIGEMQSKVEMLRAELEASVDADDASKASARTAEQRAYLRGIIAEHLRVAELAGADRRPALKAEVQELEAGFRELARGLDTASVRERVDDRLDAAALKMTEWAKRLELEWANAGLVRIDRRELTVAVQRPSGRILLQQIGSGANHVGYHLVAHLALHEFFVTQDRPVPRFLVIDQPSLPFFPAVQDKDAAANDVDWQAVKQLFELARDVVDELDGSLQVLITDHAMYGGEAWFDDALVANWHHGERLVPDDWPAADE